MGKASVIGVIAMIIFAATQNVSLNDGLNGSQDTVASHQHEVLASNIAKAGFNIGKQELTDNFADTEFTGSFEEGVYHVTIDVTGVSALVTSVGTITDAHGNTVQRTLEAKIVKASSIIQEDVPPYMDYLLLANDHLDMRGITLGDVSGDDGMSDTLNANVHTNGNLFVYGNAATIRGFGTYVNSITGRPSSSLSRAFAPYHNPNHLPDYYRVDAIGLPVFDTDVARTRVDVHQQTTGDVQLSGNLDFGGTVHNPYIYEIDGNLEFTGHTTLDGYTMFLVTGQVDFNGDVEQGDSGNNGHPESNIAIYTEGDINLGGRTTVEAQIYSGGEINFLRGTPTFRGTLATTGGIGIRGTPDVYYRPSSPSLTTVFNEDESLVGVWVREL